MRGDSVAPVTLASLAEVESQWRALEQRAHSFAQCYDYARAALSVAEQQGKLSFLVAVRDSGVLRGVWGLRLDRSALNSILRPFGSGINEEFNWPLLDDPALAERAFRQAASLAGAADCLLIYNLPAGSPLDRAAAALPFPQRVKPVSGLVIPAAKYRSWAEVEKAAKPKLRQDLRTGARRLAEQGRLTVGWREAPDEGDGALAFFFARKAEWAKEKRKLSFWLGRPETPDFFRRLARAIDRPVVAAVELDGVPIAAGICLVGPRALEYLTTTFDPGYSSFGPGKLLTRFLVEWAIERRLDFDFCITVADYKEKWPVERRDYLSRKVMLTLRGRAPEPREILRSLRAGVGGLRRRVGARIRALAG